MMLFGMKLLTLLGGIGSGLVAWLASSITRKAVVVTSVVTAFLAVTAAFLICMQTLVGSIVSLVSIPAWFSSSIGLFVPSNYAGVLALIFSAKTCRAAYDLAKEKIHLIGQSN